MSITLTVYDDESRELVEIPAYDCSEVGRMLHVHGNTVRRYVREGRWPCIKVGHVAYLTAPMIGQAVDSMTRHVGTAEPEPKPTRLGVVLDEPDTEAIE